MSFLKLQNVNFSYPMFEMSSRSLKVALAGAVAGRNGGMAMYHALRDISFQLSDGDRLGLIGRNGSGKSTLLRVIGGLAHPQGGTVRADGRVIPVIDRAIGIHPEVSGLDNIELPLRLLGATSQEVAEARKEIPDFTGLGEFIKMPFRTYSEGMKARLVFAICTALRADVLVLDEWLGAGDADFIHKAEQRLKTMVDRARILVLATHSLDLLRSVCTHVAWIDKGELLMIGPPDTVLRMYHDHVVDGAKLPEPPVRAD